VSNRSITGYHLNTFTIHISRRFSSAREFQMGNFQKYWSQNVGQDFILLNFFVGVISCGRKRCVREINVSRAWDPVHAGDKALTRETPTKRGRVNRYDKSGSTVPALHELYIWSSGYWTLINKTSTSEKKNGWIIGNNNWHRDGSDSKISSWNKIYLFVNTNIYIERSQSHL